MDEPSVIRTPYSKASRRGLPIIRYCCFCGDGVVVVISFLTEAAISNALVEFGPVHVPLGIVGREREREKREDGERCLYVDTRRKQ